MVATTSSVGTDLFQTKSDTFSASSREILYKKNVKMTGSCHIVSDTSPHSQWTVSGSGGGGLERGQGWSFGISAAFSAARAC